MSCPDSDLHVKSTIPPASVQTLIQSAQMGPNDDETMVPCPACATCELCRGAHMVSPITAHEYRRVYHPEVP